MNAIVPEKRRLNHLSTAQPNASYVWHTMAKRQILFVCNLAYETVYLSLSPYLFAGKQFKEPSNWIKATAVLQMIWMRKRYNISLKFVASFAKENKVSKMIPSFGSFSSARWNIRVYAPHTCDPYDSAFSGWNLRVNVGLYTM